MTLSIIVPVYNAAPYLKRCLDSLTASDDVQVILIDDGSTDDSWSIGLKHFVMNGFSKAVQFPKNRGVSAARNEGMRIATGEFITFLDADDYMTPNGIETMLCVIKMYGAQYDLIQFNHYRLKYGEVVTRASNVHGEFSAEYPPRLFCYVWNKVYRRQFLEEHGIGFEDGMSYGEDEIFNLECLKHTGKIFNYEGRTVVHSYENSDSLSRTVSKESLIYMADRIADFLKEDDLPQGMSAMLRRLLVKVWESNVYKRTFGE